LSQPSRMAACPVPSRQRGYRRRAPRRIGSVGVGLVLLLSIVALSACGAVPVSQTWPGLTEAGGLLYAISGSPQQVYMLDAATGTQKATYIPPGDHRGVVWWSPVIVPDDPKVDGLAFAGFSDPQARPAVYGLYAFDSQTGQEQWHVSAEDLILPAPEYAGGTVYFGSSDGQVYAVDVETRSIKIGWPFQAEEAIWGAPLAAGGRVYVPSMDHHLYCLDGQTGEVIWDFEAGGALAVQPALDAVTGILYIGSFDGHLYAIDSNSGQAVEGFEFMAGNWIWSEALVLDGTVYVTALDGKLYALDPATGAVLPPYPYDSSEVSGQPERIRTAPVQAGSNLLVATESGRVIAVKDAQKVWHWPSGTPTASVLTTPVVAGDQAYVLMMDGQLQTLGVESGVQGWSFAPPAQ
jgi:outer membrane protein assembly factor BamB